MPETRILTMNMEEHNANANLVKECLVKAMNVEGIITAEQAYEICQHWAVVMKTKGFLGRIWDTFYKGLDSDKINVQIVKRVKFEHAD